MHRTKLNIAIDFKTLGKDFSNFNYSLRVRLVSYMAYKGYGVWALIVQGLASTVFYDSYLWYFIRLETVKDFFSFVL